MDTLKGKTTLLVVLFVCAFLSEGVQGKFIDYKDFPRFSCPGGRDHEGNCKPLKSNPIPKGEVTKRDCSPATGCRSG